MIHPSIYPFLSVNESLGRRFTLQKWFSLEGESPFDKAKGLMKEVITLFKAEWKNIKVRIQKFSIIGNSKPWKKDVCSSTKRCAVFSFCNKIFAMTSIWRIARIRWAEKPSYKHFPVNHIEFFWRNYLCIIFHPYRWVNFLSRDSFTLREGVFTLKKGEWMGWGQDIL